MSSPVVYLDRSGLSRREKRGAVFGAAGHACAACASPDRLVVDHDHDTGLIRGALCWSCNVTEGQSVNRLPGLVAYLANPPAPHGWMWAVPDWWDFRHAREARARDVRYLVDVIAEARTWFPLSWPWFLD